MIMIFLLIFSRMSHKIVAGCYDLAPLLTLPMIKLEAIFSLLMRDRYESKYFCTGVENILCDILSKHSIKTAFKLQTYSIICTLNLLGINILMVTILCIALAITI